ncbi:MAG: YSIRK-type signal peptide-containing protein, partial [Limosilactobacillus sp.]|nr:YSIRK-type signal peptide-containing protein [Limosilactobacillus sp.]
MVSKNNTRLYDEKMNQNHFKYSIRKLNVGVASVLIGVGFGFSMASMNSVSVAADEVTAQTTTAATTNDDVATTTTLNVADLASSTPATPAMLAESKAATTPAADAQMGSIVSSDPAKISTDGYSLGELPQPALRSEARGKESYFNVDSNPDHYTFAVIGNFDSRRYLGRIDRSYVYSVAFSTDRTGNGQLFASFFDNNHNQLLQQEIVDTATIGGFKISKSNNVVEWWKTDGQGSVNTLYSWMTAQPGYNNTNGPFVYDNYTIPHKVTAENLYVDKNGVELGKVTITGMSGQTYTIPTTQTFDGHNSTLVDQKDLVEKDGEITARLSDFKLGDKVTLPQAGITYEAVPGNMEDYYEVVPQVKTLGYYDLPYVDESTGKLKDPSQVKTDGYGHGLVKATVVGYDKPAYIPMDEKYYRYFGNVAGFNTSLNNSTDYSYKNIYTGGTPAAIFEFKDIVSVAS